MFKRFVELMMGKSEPSAPHPKAQSTKPSMADQHPYMFAHHVLPGLFFSDPQRFLKVMGSPNGTDFLLAQWKQLSERGTGAGAPVGLDYETRRLDDGTTIILITMPLPTKVTEAYYVAAIYRPAEGGNPALNRYFTLEYGMNIMSSGTSKLLCEWTVERRHGNFGSRDIADLNGFFKAVCEQIGGNGDRWQAGFTPSKN